MANILGVGIATIDILNFVNRYPAEDSETRAIKREIKRGGNVTNSLSVISQFGHHVYWAGNRSDDENAHLILRYLEKENIDTRHVSLVKNGQTPTSYVTINQQNGSRTIVHYRDLPEYSFASFQTISLNHFDWIHFEGRAVDEAVQMMKHVREIAPNITISLEVEKTRDNIEALFRYCDLIVFSRHYVTTTPSNSPSEFLKNIRSSVPRAVLVCPWGDEGAYALTLDEEFIHSPAIKAMNVIDTLGAGDTFNAGLIVARLRGFEWRESLLFANKIAGAKCEQLGFDNLAKRVSKH